MSSASAIEIKVPIFGSVVIPAKILDKVPIGILDFLLISSFLNFLKDLISCNRLSNT